MTWLAGVRIALRALRVNKVLNREKKERPDLLQVIKGSGELSETPMH